MIRGIFVLLAAVLFLACNDSVIGPQEAIIGSRRTSQGAATVTWTFQANSSLRVVTESAGLGPALFTTQYSVDGDTVTISAFKGNDDLGAPVAFPAATCTVDINDRSLRMSCNTGITAFTRVGPGSEDNAV
jgi:hypothetical protein